VQLPGQRDVSVVICAYTADRWHDLFAAVDSVCRQQPSPAEILVVVDHSPELARRLRAAMAPDVRVLENDGPQGLSAARNTGVREASSPIVAFLDDDARAEPGWLAELVEPFADPAVVGTGGTIEPGWDTARPRWLPPELDWIVGCTYHGMARSGDTIRNPIGASMAFRREVLVDAGGFHASVGRGRRLPVGGEETELAIRVRRLHPEARIVFAAGSRVSHRVPKPRASFRYAVTRSFAEGVTKARVARLQGADLGLSTERRYAVRTLPAAVAREVAIAALNRDPSGLLRALAIVTSLGAATAGFLAGRIERRARRDVRAPGARRLRILQVTPRFAPFTGGVETHTDEVARRLAARGHDVTVATTDAGGTLPRVERRDGVTIRRVAAWPPNRDWYLAPALLPLVARGRWDVVHIQGVHTLVPPIAGLAA
jgi:GT2 family glycosyltransferase